MHEVVPSAVRNAVSAATTIFTASSINRLFFIVFWEGVNGSYWELTGLRPVKITDISPPESGGVRGGLNKRLKNLKSTKISHKNRFLSDLV